MGLTRPRAHQLQDAVFKEACLAISTSNVTLSGGAPATVDGVSVSVGDRILVQGQSTGAENGIYRVTVVGTGSNGTWVRTSDADSGDIKAGMQVMVTEGTTYADSVWKLTTDDPITVGSTSLTFEQSSAYAFGTVVAGATSLVADSVGDTLTVSAGTNISVTGDAGTDTMTIATTDAITVSGNITGGNLTTAGSLSTGLVLGNLIPSANVTYNLGNSSNRWNELFLAGGTISLGNITLKDSSGTLAIFGSDGTTPASLGNSSSVITGNLTVTASGTIEFNENVLGNIGTPVAGTDAATKQYVDDALSSVFTVTDGTTSQTIADGDTLTFSGTSNEVEVAVSATDTVTIGLPDDVTLGGGLTATTTVAATGNVTGGNLISSGAIHSGNNGVVRFYDSDGSNYVEFRSQSTVASNLQFKWPAADGTSGQVLQTDGAGTLSFATASGGGGASGFQSSTITTHPAASGDEDLATGPNDDTAETPFETGAQDAFGVSLGTVYDQMEPIGSTTTVDLGDSEAYVGA